MHYKMSMTVGQTRDHLHENATNFLLRHFALLIAHILIQIATCGIFHNQRQIMLGFNHFQQADNVRMVQTCHHLRLSLDTVTFDNVQTRLIYDLDSNLCASSDMLTKLNNAKTTFANLLDNAVASNHLFEREVCIGWIAKQSSNSKLKRERERENPNQQDGGQQRLQREWGTDTERERERGEDPPVCTCVQAAGAVD